MRDGNDMSDGKIRVLLAEMPGLLAALVERAIAHEADMRAGNAGGAVDTRRALLREPFDVVGTCSAAPDMPGKIQEMFVSESHIPILAISADGENVEVFGHRRIREVVPDSLVAVIREAALAARSSTLFQVDSSRR